MSDEEEFFEQVGGKSTTHECDMRDRFCTEGEIKAWPMQTRTWWLCPKHFRMARRIKLWVRGETDE